MSTPYIDDDLQLQLRLPLNRTQKVVQWIDGLGEESFTSQLASLRKISPRDRLGAAVLDALKKADALVDFAEWTVHPGSGFIAPLTTHRPLPPLVAAIFQQALELANHVPAAAPAVEKNTPLSRRSMMAYGITGALAGGGLSYYDESSRELPDETAGQKHVRVALFTATGAGILSTLAMALCHFRDATDQINHNQKKCFDEAARTPVDPVRLQDMTIAASKLLEQCYERAQGRGSTR